MRFTLIDRIIELQPDVSITAVKSLSLAEDYLKDHFPRFPVMPGVLMLETLVQTSAWLVRKSEDFAHGIILLKEARNVKYAGFVEPGQVLTVTAEIEQHNEQTTRLKTRGTVDGMPAVSARLILERFNASERYPERSETEAYTRRKMRKLFDILYEPSNSQETYF